MRSHEKCTTPRARPLPAFDPAASGEFARAALDGAGGAGALIGQLAVWSWVDEDDRHRFTKDFDLAVAPADLPAICSWLASAGITPRELPIGGVAVRSDRSLAGFRSRLEDLLQRIGDPRARPEYSLS